MTLTAKKYKEIIRENLGDKRYNHSLNVADACRELAELYGADPEKAYIAGILHDIRKEAAPAVLKQETAESRFRPDDIELETQALWHAVAGATYCERVLGIDDTEILEAIRFHTIGSPDMSLLAKILYVGDLISKERDFPEVEKFRKMSVSNIDTTMYKALKWAIAETLEKPGKIPAYTFRAYNHFLELHQKGKKLCQN
ncbi:phosphohydrolase [Clostridia bacterium]|nr:phosphohydrolase [Clostridia bacterium]